MGDLDRSVLCVDEDADFCQLLTLILSDFEFVIVHSKAEAITRVHHGGFALILLEYWLPDGTGDEICHHVRGFDAITPILFMTGSRTIGDLHARNIGAQGALRKTSRTFIEDLKARTAELALTS